MVSFPLEGVVECRVNSSDSVVREESVVGVERLPGFSIDFGIVLNGSLWSQPPQRRLQETDTLEDVLKLVPLLPFQSSLESALFRVFSFLPQFGHPHDEGNRRLRRLRSLCTPLERHVQKLPDFQQSSIDSFVRKYRTERAGAHAPLDKPSRDGADRDEFERVLQRDDSSPIPRGQRFAVRLLYFHFLYHLEARKQEEWNKKVWRQIDVNDDGVLSGDELQTLNLMVNEGKASEE